MSLKSMLEIRNYSFSFKLTFSNPFFSSFIPKHQKCISKMSKTLQNYCSKPNCKKIYFNIFM